MSAKIIEEYTKDQNLKKKTLNVLKIIGIYWSPWYCIIIENTLYIDRYNFCLFINFMILI